MDNPVMLHQTGEDIELAWGGKLPAMGDFVWSASRTALRAGLDHWLESGVHQLRLSQGEPWRVAFDQAPMWNFIVPCGALGPTWAAGCISPSCDRVGRRFPLVVAYGFADGWSRHSLQALLGALPEALSRTGILLFQAIRRGWTRDALSSALESSLAHWRHGLAASYSAAATRSSSVTPSDIMDVLLGERSSTEPLATTQPLTRSHCFPWSDMARSFDPSARISFWWTNGVAGAPLKAFIYDNPLQGLPLAWLFGQRLG